VSREAFEAPSTGLFDSLGVDIPGLGGPEFVTTGIAMTEDANRSTLGEARTTINANTTQDGSGVDIAVLDDGVTYDESLYGDRFAAGYDFVADRPATANNSWQNVSSAGGHGSWVAGAIAANASNDSYDGVAPNATLHVGKTLGANGGTSADIVDGLEWACDEQEVDIVSMSLGSQFYSAPIDAAVQDCADNGTLVVIAAGNSAQTTPVGIASPADSLGENPQEDGIVTVAATNTTANASGAGVAHFSQRGPDPGAVSTTYGATRGADPTVAAPGMEITAMTTDGTSTLSGTSMATPLVSGSAALILEQHPDATPADVEQRLAHGATPIKGSGVHEVGAGMVNVEQALDTQPDTDADYYDDQREARTDAAAARDTIYESLAGDVRGRWASFTEAVAG
jgi:subtilisin family serine protease